MGGMEPATLIGLVAIVGCPIAGYFARNQMTRTQWLLALVASVLLVIAANLGDVIPVGVVGLFGLFASPVGAIFTRRKG